MTSQIIYKGELRTNATHIQSGTLIETDAPTDNQGKGERFSPTDLVAVALATCMVTTMAIKARTMNIELEGTQLEVTKVMASNPRRISQLIVKTTFPKELILEEKDQKILENTAINCPVEKSLSHEVDRDMTFEWYSANNQIIQSVHHKSSGTSIQS